MKTQQYEDRFDCDIYRHETVLIYIPADSGIFFLVVFLFYAFHCAEQARGEGGRLAQATVSGMGLMRSGLVCSGVDELEM